MSSNNGIYIARFTDANSIDEYRVAYVAAIDNCNFGAFEIQEAYRVIFFGDAPIFNNHQAAWEKACQMKQQIGETEYGIVDIDFQCPFPHLSKEEAKRIIP